MTPAGFSDAPAPAGQEDLQTLHERVRTLEAALRRQHEDFEEELNQACRVQQALLPRLPHHDALRFAAVWRPAEIVGGDLYDVHMTSDGRVRLFLADATGHGVHAALKTSLVKAVSDRHRAHADGPAAFLERVNDDLADAYPGLDLRLAAACAELTVPSSPDAPVRARVAFAGLPPPLVVGPSGDRWLEDVGPYVGMLRGVPFPEREVTLAPRDRLILYTDGLTEQWAPDGRPLAPEALIPALSTTPLAAALEAALRFAEDFRRGAPQPDDLTVVACEVAGAPTSEDPGSGSVIVRWKRAR